MLHSLLASSLTSRQTNDDVWLTRTQGLLRKLEKAFFKDGAITDQVCEASDQCYKDANDPLFKGLTMSWMMDIALLIPSLKQEILGYIQSTAEAAGESCTGRSGAACGGRLYGKYDGQASMENQITGVEVFSSAMLKFLKEDAVPVNVNSGGNSSSTAKPGGEDTDASLPVYSKITTGDKAGAGILTAIFITGLIGMAAFLLMGM